MQGTHSNTPHVIKLFTPVSFPLLLLDAVLIGMCNCVHIAPLIGLLRQTSGRYVLPLSPAHTALKKALALDTATTNPVVPPTIEPTDISKPHQRAGLGLESWSSSEPRLAHLGIPDSAGIDAAKGLPSFP